MARKKIKEINLDRLPSKDEMHGTVRMGIAARNPTLYRDEYAKIAFKLIKSGSTLRELAEDLGVAQDRIFQWGNKYPEFAAALKAGNELANDRVEFKLYEKALGYTWKERLTTKKIDENGEEKEEVTEIEKQLPPDNGAMQFWLKNRRSNRWKDKYETTVNHNVTVLTSQQLESLVSEHMIDGEFTEVEREQLPAPSSASSSQENKG